MLQNIQKIKSTKKREKTLKNETKKLFKSLIKPLVKLISWRAVPTVGQNRYKQKIRHNKRKFRGVLAIRMLKVRVAVFKAKKMNKLIKLKTQYNLRQ